MRRNSGFILELSAAGNPGKGPNQAAGSDGHPSTNRQQTASFPTARHFRPRGIASGGQGVAGADRCGGLGAGISPESPRTGAAVERNRNHRALNPRSDLNGASPVTTERSRDWRKPAAVNLQDLRMTNRAWLAMRPRSDRLGHERPADEAFDRPSLPARSPYHAVSVIRFGSNRQISVFENLAARDSPPARPSVPHCLTMVRKSQKTQQAASQFESFGH